MLASWRSMTKKAGSGSGSESISQRHGSPDPDPLQNVMDPEHCKLVIKSHIHYRETVPLTSVQGEVTGRPAVCWAEATDVPVFGGTLAGRCPHTQRLRPPQLPDQEAIRPSLLPGTLTRKLVGACAYQACHQTTLQRHYTENSKYIFPEKELRGNSPKSYIHVSVCDL